MRRAATRDPVEYLARLAVDASLLDDLVAEVTVGEAHFFRAPEQFSVIMEELLRPRPAAAHGRPLRIWSAGCASGEEPYTMAILLHRLGLLGDSSILGTDISRAALAKAQRARYTRWSLRGVDAGIVQAYFKPARDEFELIPEIKNSVEFRYLNLVEDAYPSLAAGVWGMELILCRNVLIYFDAETAARVTRRLIATLSPDGWLVLGATDPTASEPAACEAVLTGAGLVYRRRGREEAGLQRTITSWSAPAEPIATASFPGALAATEATPDLAREIPSPSPHEYQRWSEQREESPRTGSDDRSDPGARPALGPEPETPSEAAARAYAGHDYSNAIVLAERAVRRDPAHVGSWIVLVRSLANQGELAAAGRACAAALDRHRTSAELHYLHAVLLGEAGRHVAAATAARRALYLDPRLVPAHLALATALARAGAAAGARRAIRNARRLLEAMPNDAPVPSGDGETVGRLLEMTQVHLSLLGEEAA
jgi:chemotaxis protein methyltransferase CheR